MKRLFRSVVSVVVCTLALMPAAWGRDNRIKAGHPTGDDRVTLMASSHTRSSFVVLVPKSLLGAWWPSTVWIRLESKETSRTSVKNLAARGGIEVSK